MQTTPQYSIFDSIIFQQYVQQVILVTGGTGFLGSTLIKRLIEDGNPVIAIKRESSIIPDSLTNSTLIQWVDADITDYFSLADNFTNITEVYHCAAQISYQKNAEQMNNINIEGTKNIVNLCLEYNARLVHVSSIAALGTNKLGKPVNEKDKWEFDKNLSKYSLSKYKAELEVWRGTIEGLKAVIVNPSLIMGASAGKNGSGVVFDLVNKGLPIYTTGSIGIVDVDDVAKAMIILMQRKEIYSERFILNSENISNKALLQRIAGLLNKKAPSIEAKPFLLGLAWRMAKFASFFTGKKPTLTKESSRAAAAQLSYTNEKICNAIEFTFKPLNQTLQEIAQTYTNIKSTN